MASATQMDWGLILSSLQRKTLQEITNLKYDSVGRGVGCRNTRERTDPSANPTSSQEGDSKNGQCVRKDCQPKRVVGVGSVT